MVGVGRTWPHDLRFFLAGPDEDAEGSSVVLDGASPKERSVAASEASALVMSWGQTNDAGGLRGSMTGEGSCAGTWNIVAVFIREGDSIVCNCQQDAKKEKAAARMEESDDQMVSGCLEGWAALDGADRWPLVTRWPRRHVMRERGGARHRNRGLF